MEYKQKNILKNDQGEVLDTDDSERDRGRGRKKDKEEKEKGERANC
jgi:hypothetical protein